MSMCVLCHCVVHVYDCGSSDICDCSECVTLPGELDCGYCSESGLKTHIHPTESHPHDHTYLHSCRSKMLIYSSKFLFKKFPSHILNFLSSQRDRREYSGIMVVIWMRCVSHTNMIFMYADLPLADPLVAI